jgi:elongation factor P
MATTSDIKKGVIIKFKEEPHLVAEFQHVNPGKGSAFVRTRLRNLRTGKVFENTYKSGETIELLDVEKKKMQYLYKEGVNYNFMDNRSFEQVAVNEDLMMGGGAYLKEGQEVTVLTLDDIPVGIEMPMKITLKVTEAAPAIKGDTASGHVTKEVTLENGLTVKVPLFIKEGDEVILNTETGEYVERA